MGYVSNENEEKEKRGIKYKKGDTKMKTRKNTKRQGMRHLGKNMSKTAHITQANAQGRKQIAKIRLGVSSKHQIVQQNRM